VKSKINREKDIEGYLPSSQFCVAGIAKFITIWQWLKPELLTPG